MSRVAIVHDWLTGMRGGERVLEALIDLHPAAEIFTLIHRPGSVSPKIESRPIHESWLGRLPAARERYRFLLPLFPAAIESFDLDGFDLVISSSHCAAKGVIPPLDIPHVCYCHTPMRYIRDQYDEYFGAGRASPLVRAAAAVTAPRLRRWDTATARRVTRFIANSNHVRSRIRRHYDREARVIHPPVDVDRFSPAQRRDDFFVCVSALVPYKRIDLAIEAFNALGRRLVIAGEGPDRSRLSRLAGPTIEFTGRITDDEVAAILGRARAFVMPGEEDFGIAAVEAQAAGAPVIALGRGGALESVIGLGSGERSAGDGNRAAAGAGPTGVFFDEPTVASLSAAIRRFESVDFDVSALRRNARRFEPAIFRARMSDEIATLLEDRRTAAPRSDSCASLR
jgi:glycosyltransferase involved in cell wall biosynthesis